MRAFGVSSLVQPVLIDPSVKCSGLFGAAQGRCAKRVSLHVCHNITWGWLAALVRDEGTRPDVHPIDGNLVLPVSCRRAPKEDAAYPVGQPLGLVEARCDDCYLVSEVCVFGSVGEWRPIDVSA